MSDAPRPLPAVLRRLLAEPERFSFDAALAATLQPVERLRFAASTGLAFVSRDIDAAELEDAGGGERIRIRTGLIGLTGPAGAMPRFYTELVNAERRHRLGSLADFLDMLAQRPVAQFAGAPFKYRPHLAAHRPFAASGAEAGCTPMDDALSAFVGRVAANGRMPRADGADPVLFYAGAFSAHPRSASHLAAILADWFGDAVKVEEFSGCWRSLEASERTRLPQGAEPGRHHRLGLDAAIGAATWDIQSRIVLRVGPLSRARFEALLPGGDALAPLISLAGRFLDPSLEIAVNPVLLADEVPSLALGAETSSRLGLSSWLTTSLLRPHDPADVLFPAIPAARSLFA